MEELKKQIVKYITDQYKVKSSKGSDFHDLVCENMQIIESNANRLVEELESQITSCIKNSMAQIKTNSNSTEYKHLHAVRLKMSQSDLTIEQIGKALCQNQSNKKYMAMQVWRKLGPCKHSSIDDIDLQRLRKLGIEV